MSEKIVIERFTRLKMSISGQFRPRELPRLAEYLPGDEGEIRFSISGSESIDAAGRQTRRLKCIISGWFLLIDPISIAPEAHAVEIQSRLVVVPHETELPPLEAESADEDYIVCASEMDVRDRIEEEILLDLPANVVRVESAEAGSKPVKPGSAAKTRNKVSPFAKLAVLKKKA